MAFFKCLMVIAIFTIPIVAGIRCFVCNSVYDADCMDVKANDTQSRFVEDCKTEHEGSEPFCRKTKFTILGDDEITRVSRSCGWIVHKQRNDTCINGNTDFKRERSCQCFTDFCNGSPHIALNSFIFIVPFLVFSFTRFI